MAANLTNCPGDYTLTLPGAAGETLAITFPRNCRVSHWNCSSDIAVKESGTDGATMTGGMDYDANSVFKRELPPREAAAAGVTLYVSSTGSAPTLSLKLRPDCL